MENKFIQPSRKILSENKRIEKQTSDFLTEFYQKRRDAETLAETTKAEAAMSAARFSYAASIANSKNRVKNLQETIRYNERASVTGMTHMLSQIVESALLLDEEEYSKLNPNYKTEIRDIVRGFLENAEINKDIKNADTLKLMEHVARLTPDVKIGTLLSEAELSKEYDVQTPEEVSKTIEKLSKSVKKKIAKIVGKEQKRVDELQSEIDQLVSLTNPEEEVVEQIPPEEPAGAEEIPEEAVETEVPAEEVAPEEAPAVSDQGQVELQSAEGKKLHITISLGEQFYREHRREGLLETLAVNEAVNMIAEGKEYNADLAIANSVLYLTILEAFNETSLMDVDEKAYDKVIKNAGGNINDTINRALPNRTVVKATDVGPLKNEEADTAATSVRRYLKRDLEKKFDEDGFDLEVDHFEEIAESQGYVRDGIYYIKK